MSVLRAIGIALICASPLSAQAVSSLNPPSADLSGYATTADVASAISNATPAPCPAPLSDALTATAGVQALCMTRPDAQRATQVQRTMVVTASDGSFSGTWPVAFPTAPGWYQADIDIPTSTSAPYKCSFTAGTVTATSFTGRCTQLVSTTLGASLTAVLNLTISPIANATGGLTVRIAGRL